MKQFYNIVYADYLQRTRSYTFLIILGVSLYFTYLFVPLHEANYTTLRIGKYIGLNTSAWNGYVTALMSSVFLTMTGFYLVNSNIKKDVTTGVGMIIAATSIGNFRYLLAKTCSNFLLLLSITGIISLMSMAVFVLRGSNYPFILSNFICPFLLVTLPALFVISCIAVVAETFLYRYTILMNIGYYILFISLLVPQQSINPMYDLLGIKSVTRAMQELIRQQYHEHEVAVGMGFLIGHKENLKAFRFEGISWSSAYLISRLVWMSLAMGLVYLSSLVFHRFDFARPFTKLRQLAGQTKMRPGTDALPAMTDIRTLKEIRLSELPPLKNSYRIVPILKTELLMLYRKGPRWLWLINIGGMLALALAPLTIAHQMILPLLWFLQVARWSDISTKERNAGVHLFSYASYKPLYRVFTAQVLSAIILSLCLALPMLIRLAIYGHFTAVAAIILGGVMIVMTAIILGLISGGKKLFEILFFMLTYSNMNKVPVLDYFGGVNQGSLYLITMIIITAGLTIISYAGKKIEISRL
jgi:hypothetical protein